MKRSSTRNVVLSKAMKHVDEETRREFRERRLQALECDNYNETEAVQADDDAYNESDDEKGGAKRKRAKASQKGTAAKSKWATRAVRPLERILLDNGIVREVRAPTSTATATEPEVMDIDTDSEESIGGVETKQGDATRRNNGKGALARSNSGGFKSGISSSSSQQRLQDQEPVEVNYHTIAARPSVLPMRQCFCSVCGYIGHYSCTRCGSKFCSIKCNESHKETRCFKFSI